MQEADILKALANEKRLTILSWLKEPQLHFPPQVDGDLVDDGVCAQFIAEKLGITPATLSEHMRVLALAGLVRQKKLKQWIFYKRDEQGLQVAKALVQSL